MLNFNIKMFRTKEGLTQEELGKRVGKDTAEICRYESGERIPRLDTLLKMATIFKTSVDTLVHRNWEAEIPLRASNSFEQEEYKERVYGTFK